MDERCRGEASLARLALPNAGRASPAPTNRPLCPKTDRLPGWEGFPTGELAHKGDHFAGGGSKKRLALVLCRQFGVPDGAGCAHLVEGARHIDAACALKIRRVERRLEGDDRATCCLE